MWPLRSLIRVMRRHYLTIKRDKDNDKYKDKHKYIREHLQRDPRNFWDLRHWLQFWQLRTWFHDNLCYLTIKSDTGQHSQFLQCFSSSERNGLNYWSPAISGSILILQNNIGLNPKINLCAQFVQERTIRRKIKFGACFLMSKV